MDGKELQTMIKINLWALGCEREMEASVPRLFSVTGLGIRGVKPGSSATR
jgi:hypothetical protein